MHRWANDQLDHETGRFVDEYLIDLNATQAAIRAGYSPRSAARIGSRLPRRARVQTAIHAERMKLSARPGILFVL
ncbi:MAG: terminase small subunit [Rhodanobacter sp.]